MSKILKVSEWGDYEIVYLIMLVLQNLSLKFNACDIQAVYLAFLFLL